MTFDLSPEQLTLRDEARAFATTRVAPAAAAIDEAGEAPADLVTDTAALVARAGGPLEQALVIEELAATGAGLAAAVAIGAGHDGFPGLRGARAVQPGFADARVRLMTSALALGLARTALEAAEDVCRRAGERPGGAADERPHWALADAATEMDAARLLVWQAAQVMGRKPDAQIEMALAQTLAIGAAERAVAAALRIVGPDAYKQGTLLERASRDVRTLAFIAGTEDEHRAVAAQALPQ